MPKIACTELLEKIGPSELTEMAGGTVLEVIENAAQHFPKLKNYILEDQSKVRKHIAIFVNGELQKQSEVLDQRVNDATEIYIMQALSGG